VARGAYLALIPTARAPDAAARLGELAARLAAEGDWAVAASAAGVQVWTAGEAPPPVSRLPNAAGVLVGDAFPMPGGAPLSALPARLRSQDPLPDARWLSRNVWGRYVALFPDAGADAAIYRDPSGLWDGLIWRLGEGLWGIASDLNRAPPWLRPRRMSLNWDRIARYTALPTAFTSDSLFDDVEAVGPGELVRLGGKAAAPTLIWRPSEHLGAGRCDRAAAQAELLRRVDCCTSALAGRYDKLIVQLSGGLDSSILAGSLAATGHAPRVVQWLNRVGDRAEADERAYARAVADRLGVPLTAVVKPLAPLTEADLRDLGDAFWPAMDGLEPWRDRDEAARLIATGARAVVSGQGGDAIFFQPPTPLIVADALRAEGLGVVGSPLLAEVARRTRKSVWRVLAEARRASRGKAPPTMAPSSLMTAETRALAAGALHRWAADARERDAPPAKQMQIVGLANHHVYHGDSRSRRVGDTLFPLLAQPVLEHCLSIPIPDLVRGGDDRPFARAAFADRLPDLVLQRRRKGNYSAFFAHLVAVSLDTLRPLLLDGCLCRAGVLDRAAVERMLDVRQLICSPRAAELLWAASVEAWLRHWQTRVPDSPAAARRR
jgi:asparagine synthase (glutamine-hydrolysing)